MGRRVAAAWALLGFSSQCVIAAFTNLNLVTGFERAMIHYLVWGLAGFVVGTVCEKIIEDSFRNQFAADDVETHAKTFSSES